MYAQAFENLINVDKKAELGKTLASEISTISIYDIQAISARLEREIRALPSPYREQIRPYFITQYFVNYFNILAMTDNGSLDNIKGDIKDKALFKDYCKTVIKFLNDGQCEPDNGRIWQGGFYYLVSCFMMFVLEEPGHPVGMPFPGGFKVKEKDGVVYCPIRDKEKDVEYSICNFCPAKQDETI